MTIGQFFAILRARWMVLISLLLVVVATVVTVGFLWPKTYTATASLVVDPKPDPVSAALNPTLASPVFMATQVEILQSPRVSQRVVANLKLADNVQVRQQWQEASAGQISIEEWLAQTLERALDVKPSRESNVITVNYKSADPRFAAALANAYVKAYIDVALEMRTNPAKEYSNFFDARLKSSRDQFEAAQAKLTAFQRGNGLMATDERLDVENQRLVELTSQFIALDAVATESASRQSQAQGRNSEMLQDVMANPLVTGLKSDIARGEAALKAMASRLGDSHPQVIETRANLAELRQKLEAETKRATGSVGVTNSINVQRQARVRSELEIQRAKVLRLKALRDEAAVLQRDVENSQRAYDAVQARLTQTSLESDSKQTNLYPLTVATAPLEPSSPKLTLNALLAVFGGTMLGVIAALALEFNDRRVRSASDIATLFGLPMMGVLSDGTRRVNATNRSSLPALVGGAAPRRLSAPRAK